CSTRSTWSFRRWSVSTWPSRSTRTACQRPRRSGASGRRGSVQPARTGGGMSPRQPPGGVFATGISSAFTMERPSFLAHLGARRRFRFGWVWPSLDVERYALQAAGERERRLVVVDDRRQAVAPDVDTRRAGHPDDGTNGRRADLPAVNGQGEPARAAFALEGPANLVRAGRQLQITGRPVVPAERVVDELQLAVLDEEGVADVVAAASVKDALGVAVDLHVARDGPGAPSERGRRVGRDG